MVILAIFATLVAGLWTLFVMFANGMSDAPAVVFQGSGSIYAAWIITAFLWFAWGVG